MAQKKKTPYNDNNITIAYYRFSSHSQNEASIDQQREAAQKYAAAKGFTIVREYENRAISGTTEDRPGYQRMLSEVAKIRPAALIISPHCPAHFCRLCRRETPDRDNR